MAPLTSPVSLQINGGECMSWVRIVFGGSVDRGVVHGREFESLNFGVNGDVVHGRGFESLSFFGQWWSIVV
jgi:hypothetical protein